MFDGISLSLHNTLLNGGKAGKVVSAIFVDTFCVKRFDFRRMTMNKYNISTAAKKEAAYRALVSPKLMNRLKSRIVYILLKKKKYRDKEYSAKRLAEDLGTNTRYVSAVVNVCFDMNYTSLVNKYRIDYAKSLLVDRRYQELRMEEISDMCGFSNRQSFYAAFYKFTGFTPRRYKLDNATTSGK